MVFIVQFLYLIISKNLVTLSLWEWVSVLLIVLLSGFGSLDRFVIGSGSGFSSLDRLVIGSGKLARKLASIRFHKGA
jgi:hypothetical protein